ncbi:hypothetical protein [Micromonospora sp. NPDC023633]|uniref:hypothetical protein n=1 Tax=Micromonospora sp. NPDC023633 TaxID=3154320 RepID=UPI0033D682F7
MGGLVALRGSAPASVSGFVVGYVGPGGRERREDLGAVAGVAFELVSPVRTMTEILTAVGFTVRGSTNDFAPLTLEILDGPALGDQRSGKSR